MVAVANHGARAGVAVILSLAAAAIAWVFSYWFWQLSLRPSVPIVSVLENQPAILAQQVRNGHVFGVSGDSIGPVSEASGTAQMVLAGIVSSGSDQRGVAMILVDGKKTVTAKVGQEIVPGTVLSRVARDHVELTQRGQVINLRLSTKK